MRGGKDIIGIVGDGRKENEKSGKIGVEKKGEGENSCKRKKYRVEKEREKGKELKKEKENCIYQPAYELETQIEIIGEAKENDTENGVKKTKEKKERTPNRNDVY